MTAPLKRCKLGIRWYQSKSGGIRRETRTIEKFDLFERGTRGDAVKQRTTEDGKTYQWTMAKDRFKRVGAMIQQLELEECIKIEKERRIPFFKAGDAISVTYARSTKSDRSTTVSGMVIGKRNASLGSTFRLLCSVSNTPVEMIFSKYSPLIREIKVVQEAFLHRGKKRVRRSKLYYVQNRPQSLYAVTPATIKEMERRNRRLANIQGVADYLSERKGAVFEEPVGDLDDLEEMRDSGDLDEYVDDDSEDNDSVDKDKGEKKD